MDVDDLAIIQAHFDSVDLPAGVEAPIPWFPDFSPSKRKAFKGSSSSGDHGRGSVKPWPFGSSKPSQSDNKVPSVSSSSLPNPINASIHPPVLGQPSPFPLIPPPGGSKNENKSAVSKLGGSNLNHSFMHSSLGSFSTNANSYQSGPMMPPFGVAPPTWGQGTLPGQTTGVASGSSYPEVCFDDIDSLDDPLFVQPAMSWWKQPWESISVLNNLNSHVSFHEKNDGSDITPQELADIRNQKAVNEEDILKKFKLFKKFDTVEDFSDHHYSSKGVKQPAKSWVKKIQDEWRILENDLPDTIFVRVCEARMDLLRAVIIGAEGTPYHDGLFFFDVFFPASYPKAPPNVYYHSGGLRLNPNLYNCGKVCLSLLNTWSGDKNEKWIPGTSTMLQVLVSIQALILNQKPYFNEPGYANLSGTPQGEMMSQQYNENTFILSLRTMFAPLCPCARADFSSHSSSSASAMMNPSTSTMFFFLFFTSFFIEHVSSTATQVSDDYCSSFFPDVTPGSGFGSYMIENETAHAGFYLGGNPNPNPDLSLTSDTNAFSFSISWTRKTNKDDVLMIGATMVPGSPLVSGSYFRPEVSNSWLQGFWSISSGKLCVVGTVAFFVSGNQHSPAAGLKVNNFKNSNSITSLITGTLECLSSSHDRNCFEPLSVLMIPRLGYEYTLVPGKSGDWFSSGSDTEQNLPLNTLPEGRFCEVVSGVENVYFLNYTSTCSSAKNCLPFSGVVGSLPAFVSLRRIECLEVNKTIRVLVEFLNYSYDGFSSRFSSSWLFNLNMSMIGEGFWDDKKNVLYVSLCQFLGITEPWSNAHIGDCTARLSLRLPAILSIKQNSRFLGQIWSCKTLTDSGYFDRIEFQSTEDVIREVPGLKYEYSEINRVKNLCPTKAGGNKEDIYPSGYSNFIDFHMKIKNSKGERGRGFASPLSVGDRIYWQGFPLVALPPLSSATVVPSSRENSGPVNISYKIDITTETRVGNC
ncbi:hypothetical protein SLEP1_g26672 [Rubroshorea leprosula]|nr:hypothetical protein SLEP1_g26672 [Rubroshorea leprosula]